jgi:hypothetical protein
MGVFYYIVPKYIDVVIIYGAYMTVGSSLCLIRPTYTE